MRFDRRFFLLFSLFPPCVQKFDRGRKIFDTWDICLFLLLGCFQCFPSDFFFPFVSSPSASCRFYFNESGYLSSFSPFPFFLPSGEEAMETTATDRARTSYVNTLPPHPLRRYPFPPRFSRPAIEFWTPMTPPLFPSPFFSLYSSGRSKRKTSNRAGPPHLRNISCPCGVR